MADPHAYREAVVAKLRYLLELRNLSVTTLEKNLGRGRGYVSDALRGEKRFALEVLFEVLAYLEIEPEEFFAGRTSEEARWLPGGTGARQRGSEIADKKVTAELLRRIEQRAKASGDPLLEDVSGLLKLLTRVLEVQGLVTADDVEAVLSDGSDSERERNR